MPIYMCVQYNMHVQCTKCIYVRSTQYAYVYINIYLIFVSKYLFKIMFVSVNLYSAAILEIQKYT